MVRLFRGGGSRTAALNQWTGFYMITASVMKGLVKRIVKFSVEVFQKIYIATTIIALRLFH